MKIKLILYTLFCIYVYAYINIIFYLFQILPSPTTGSFANNQGFNWKNNYEEKQENVKAEEETISSSFSFQVQPAGFQSSNAIVQNVCNQFKFTRLIYNTYADTKKIIELPTKIKDEKI